MTEEHLFCVRSVWLELYSARSGLYWHGIDCRYDVVGLLCSWLLCKRCKFVVLRPFVQS